MKRKALYITRNPKYWGRSTSSRQDLISNVLRQKFDLDCLFDFLQLDEKIMQDYALLVTHLPNNHSLEGKFVINSEGLNKIKRIHKENPNLVVVIYTGAERDYIGDEDLKNIGVDRVIRKRHLDHIDYDIKELSDCLDTCFRL